MAGRLKEDGRIGKAGEPKPMMNGHEKSDPAVVCAGQRPDQEG